MRSEERISQSIFQKIQKKKKRINFACSQLKLTKQLKIFTEILDRNQKK